jgi:hypothetical protein
MKKLKSRSFNNIKFKLDYFLYLNDLTNILFEPNKVKTK